MTHTAEACLSPPLAAKWLSGLAALAAFGLSTVAIQAADSLLMPVSGDPARLGPRTYSFDPDRVNQPMPMTLVRGAQPTVEVSIDGGPPQAVLIDTGTNISVFPLATHVTTEGANHYLDELCFGNGTCLQQPRVLLEDNNYSRSGSGAFNGIVGTDVLRLFVLSIDYAHDRLTLGNATADVGGDDPTLPFSMDARSFRPQIDGRIGGMTFPSLLLDTGATFTRVDRKHVLALGTGFQPLRREVAFATTAQQWTTISKPVEVCVGGLVCGSAELQDAPWSGIGASFFSHYLTIFDFPNHRLMLVPQRGATARQSLMQRWGLQVSLPDPGAIVVVAYGSPAARAGILTTDRISAVNDMPLTALGYIGLHRVLEDVAIKTVRIQLKSKVGVLRSVELQSP